jgi:hypothetical protein
MNVASARLSYEEFIENATTRNVPDKTADVQRHWTSRIIRSGKSGNQSETKMQTANPRHRQNPGGAEPYAPQATKVINPLDDGVGS